MALQVEDSTRTEQTLIELERQLEAQTEETRKLRKNAAFFGAMITLVAFVSLIAVTTKLGTKDIHVTTTSVTKAPAAPAAAVPAAPATAAAPSATAVALKEFKVLSTQDTLAAGKVIFKVRNSGTVTHEFVVLKTNHPAAKLPLYKGRADEAGNVGETGDLKPGQSKNLSLILAPGHYALICNLPGHYLAGQHTDLTVK